MRFVPNQISGFVTIEGSAAELRQIAPALEPAVAAVVRYAVGGAAEDDVVSLMVADDAAAEMSRIWAAISPGTEPSSG